MRALPLALALLVGCVGAHRVPVRTVETQQPPLHDVVRELQARVDALEAPQRQLGGPEASEPVASLGTWVPVQATRHAMLGALSGSPFGGSGGASFFSRVAVPTNGKVCFDGATCAFNLTYDGVNLNVNGGNLVLNSGAFIASNSTSAILYGVITSNVASGSNALALATNGARLDLGTGASDYFASDGTFITTPTGLTVTGYSDFQSTLQIDGSIYQSGLAGTAGSGTGITTAGPYTPNVVYKVIVAENALTAAATTQDVTIWTLPARFRLVRVLANATVGFTGGGLTNMQVMCGPSGGSATYLVNNSIFAAAVLGDAAAEIGSSLLSATVLDIPSMASTSTVVCRFTSTTANVVAATAGSVTFYIEGIAYP